MFFFGGFPVGVVIGVGDGEGCVDFFLPGVELGEEGLGFVGEFFVEVLFFGRVVFEVIELDVVVFEELDQFEIPSADGAAGHGAPLTLTGAEVAGEMPVERVAIERF